jgi:hypothetical protein
MNSNKQPAQLEALDEQYGVAPKMCWTVADYWF